MIYLGHNSSGVTVACWYKKVHCGCVLSVLTTFPSCFKKSRLFVWLETTNYSMQYSWLSDSMNAAVFV